MHQPARGPIKYAPDQDKNEEGNPKSQSDEIILCDFHLTLAGMNFWNRILAVASSILSRFRSFGPITIPFFRNKKISLPRVLRKTTLVAKNDNRSFHWG